MKKYFKVYWLLIKINFSVLSGYRGNFINSLISSTSWALFSLVSTFLLTTRSGTIFGWTREMFFAMTATYAIFIGLFHGLFSWNFDRLAQIIHKAELDGLLLKPLDSQFLVSVWRISFVHISRVIMGVSIFLYLISIKVIAPTFFDVFLYIMLIGTSLLLLYSIWFIVLTSTIWFSHLNNLVEIMYTVSSIGGRLPKEAFEQVSGVLVIFIFPLILTISTPTLAILRRSFGYDVFYTVFFAVLLFIITRKFWQYALRSYTSASG